MSERRSIVVGWVIVALLAAAVLGGCGRKAQEETGAAVAPPPAQGAPEGAEAVQPPAPEETPGAAVSLPQKLQDVIARMPDSFVAEMTITDGSQTHIITTAMKLRNGRPVRMRSEMGGEQGVVLIDYENKTMYTWSESEGRGTRMSLSAGAGNAGKNPYEGVKPDTVITGSDTVNGIECWTAEVTDQEGHTTTLWFNKENGLIQKAVLDGTTITYNYSQLGAVPDDQFEVPAGIELTDLSNLPQMPQAPHMPEMPDMPQMPHGGD